MLSNCEGHKPYAKYGLLNNLFLEICREKHFRFDLTFKSRRALGRAYFNIGGIQPRLGRRGFRPRRHNLSDVGLPWPV